MRKFVGDGMNILILMAFMLKVFKLSTVLPFIPYAVDKTKSAFVIEFVYVFHVGRTMHTMHTMHTMYTIYIPEQY